MELRDSGYRTILRALFITGIAFNYGPTVRGAEEQNRQSTAVLFSRDIAPILSANCFECHGPDESQREAELRLDRRSGAMARLESGDAAIVPGNILTSTLIQRIMADDDSKRMPPAGSNRELSSGEIQRLKTWIEQGAPWDEHWAFRQLQRMDVPKIKDNGWVRTPVDAFVLGRLHAARLSPAPPADRRTLIRRVYMDLIGLPPTPDQVAAFESDSSTDAYSQLVDRLLASPHYGERWGRYWLDVARYGDSNGGDENHLYPYAFRYRNYVIDAWNEGLPYNDFVRQQVAGDLLPKSGSADPVSALTATGFLAIGMKILAEQDPVKKRADIVDEQIDTLGRSIMGLTLGCARCHDHKFDPVPTADYYALAGIFHSTEIADHKLETPAYLRAREQYVHERALLERALKSAEQRIAAQPDGVIVLQAEAFARGNVSVIADGYGEGIGIISDPGAQNNFVEYDVELPQAGRYVLQLRYAAASSRPGRLSINGHPLKNDAVSQTTGGWSPADQKWFTEGTFDLIEGINVVRLESSPMMSHIDQVRFISAGGSTEIVEALAEITTLQRHLAKLAASAPSAELAMAVSDGQVQNVRVHLRGNHLSLGDEVQRGFLSVFGSSDESPPGASQSGRRELADWLTRRDTHTASLTSRVIANRIWTWHFGRGLVDTPDNFGVQGARPTHPQLLDWLARRLVEHEWSIKHLHRDIVLSSTYCAASRPLEGCRNPESAAKLYAFRMPKRVEAELFRDSLLLVANALDRRLGDAPPDVKSGDPSPDDLRKNREAYDRSRRRTVYLPIVRSNVYNLLTLLDFPDSATPVGKRAATIVPTQSLLLMNSPFIVEQSERIAARVLARPVGTERRIGELYGLLFGRPASRTEISMNVDFLNAFAEIAGPETDAWTALCHTLVTSHEFFYIR